MGIEEIVMACHISWSEREGEIETAVIACLFFRFFKKLLKIFIFYLLQINIFIVFLD